jgi:hypothetical protein
VAALGIANSAARTATHDPDQLWTDHPVRRGGILGLRLTITWIKVPSFGRGRSLEKGASNVIPQLSEGLPRDVAEASGVYK